jgi:hypothetical protein
VQADNKFRQKEKHNRDNLPVVGVALFLSRRVGLCTDDHTQTGPMETTAAQIFVASR